MPRRLTLIILLALILLAGSQATAIERVAVRLTVVDFYGGYTTPLGTYDNIAGILLINQIGQPIQIDADEAWDPSFYLGANYGQVWNNHMLVSAGFRYTKAETDDRLDFGGEQPSINIYDLELNANWLFLDILRNPWSPYFGIGLHAGLTEQNWRHFSNEYETTLDLGLNFGADLKLWSSTDGRSFVTLSSINNWAITASDERPRYMHIGGGIKYFFRH